MLKCSNFLDLIVLFPQNFVETLHTPLLNFRSRSRHNLPHFPTNKPFRKRGRHQSSVKLSTVRRIVIIQIDRNTKSESPLNNLGMNIIGKVLEHGLKMSKG